MARCKSENGSDAHGVYQSKSFIDRSSLMISSGCRIRTQCFYLVPLLVTLATLPRAWSLEAALESKPSDPYFEKYNPRKVPVYSGSLLKKGDKLAIVGDSITEQKMYSRIIEAYLT